VALRFNQWQAAKQAGWSQRYAAEAKRLGDKVISPKLGKRVLTEVTRADWVDLVISLRKKAPGTAAWLYGVLSSFLNFAEAAGWVDANPLPRRGQNQIAPKVAARERVLSDEELVKVWRGAAKLSPKTRCFARLLIMTAARLSEAAGIAAGEVSFIAATWTILGARTKNRLPLTVPLHPLLQVELRAVWPAERISGGYRLLGAIKGSGFTAPSKAKLRLDELTGITGWRWHDLRRSARTGMSVLGVDSRGAESALNHISDRSQLQRVYDRYDYTREALLALQTWQAHVAALIAKAESAAA
jgi:integrase